MLGTYKNAILGDNVDNAFAIHRQNIRIGLHEITVEVCRLHLKQYGATGFVHDIYHGLGFHLLGSRFMVGVVAAPTAAL